MIYFKKFSASIIEISWFFFILNNICYCHHQRTYNDLIFLFYFQFLLLNKFVGFPFWSVVDLQTRPELKRKIMTKILYLFIQCSTHYVVLFLLQINVKLFRNFTENFPFAVKLLCVRFRSFRTLCGFFPLEFLLLSFSPNMCQLCRIVYNCMLKKKKNKIKNIWLKKCERHTSINIPHSHKCKQQIINKIKSAEVTKWSKEQ